MSRLTTTQCFPSGYIPDITAKSHFYGTSESLIVSVGNRYSR